MRRIVQYLILAAVLVGLPLGCAWIGGYDEVLADVAKIAPQCERWVDDPTRLWSVKCPFSWIFAASFFIAALSLASDSLYRSSLLVAFIFSLPFASTFTP